jgi:cytochrome c oxidase subunit 2
MNPRRLLPTMLLMLAWSAPAMADTPLGYLTADGARAMRVLPLTWGLLIISIAVCIIITALVAVGTWLRRSRSSMPIETVPVESGSSGLPWLYIGVGISTVVLLGSLIWTVAVLAAVNTPAEKFAATIEVTGQQWWWKGRYLSDDPSRVFTTADEFHIPVGQPVRIKLIGADVIHSFWVPKLTGKTDAIPGQINETWIEASHPGRFSGTCSEFCGPQHAHMSFAVVADSPAAFKAWEDAQVATPAAPADARLARGLQSFVYKCGSCHTVRGTDAGGTVAPDLTHLMSRSIIAGGVVDNTPGNLAGWIANPQALKPGTNMPIIELSGAELQDIAAYLETLQ